jgi:hypothetical protein
MSKSKTEAPTIKKIDAEFKMDSINIIQVHVELEEKKYSLLMQLLREVLMERLKGEGRSEP